MKTLARLAGLTIAAVAMLAAPALAKEWTTVNIGTEGAFPPWNATKPDGTLEGFEIDLAADLCERMKVKCNWVIQSWDGIIPALQAGKFDAIMSGMSATAKREEVIAFTEPYGSTGQTFAVSKSSDLAKLPLNGELFPLASKPEETAKAIETIKPYFKGKVIGVQASSIAEGFLQKNFADVAEIREYGKTQEHDLDLASGRVDAIMASMAYVGTASKEPGNEEMTAAGPRFQGGMLGKGSSIGLRKGDDDLKAMFDKAIEEAKNDGTIKKLSEKWFGFDVTVY
ncbi:transporter substrate-binding domain-containing protein [Consotaella salsifontis]|uniref:Amino acid ABC transporter substrate-binding protein, PAAT family n=1 Tax=Consotaella salsifontis TaxID=1365950 RepID=A0A1T4SEE2_9HYPH|nr:transporter substrate-binding domain-containing protein [Consotaella salsifontis]SKA26268.1 amino acid ABC transporter substrate-binding protein, PAAT family [Consotaella salsifontis]